VSKKKVDDEEKATKTAELKSLDNPIFKEQRLMPFDTNVNHIQYITKQSGAGARSLRPL